MPLREEDIKPITATPEWQLARELADPRVGKTEREHYAARRIADLEERIAWMTMRGTDELPRNDLEGNRIREELTGQALVEYLRAQRRAERERAEMAERERDEARAERDAATALLLRIYDCPNWYWATAIQELLDRLKGGA